MFFRSAVDPWFYALVVSLPALLLTAVIPNLAGANSTIIALTVSGLMLITIIPGWILVSTYYRVDSVVLRVQSGPFFWSVPLEQIRAVTLKKSWVSSPALSYKRFEITYGKERSILVSPKHKVAFLEAIGQQPANVLRKSSAPNPFGLGKQD